MQAPITSTQQCKTIRRFKKRIGSTTFQVSVHFNQNSKETASDKFARIIRNEATTAFDSKVVNL